MWAYVFLNGHCESEILSSLSGAGVMFENTEVVIEERTAEEEGDDDDDDDDDMPEKVGFQG